MNTKRQDRVPNKAGMDNRWGCFVGDVFCSIYPPSRFNEHPRVSGVGD